MIIQLCFRAFQIGSELGMTRRDATLEGTYLLVLGTVGSIPIVIA